MGGMLKVYICIYLYIEAYTSVYIYPLSFIPDDPVFQSKVPGLADRQHPQQAVRVPVGPGRLDALAQGLLRITDFDKYRCVVIALDTCVLHGRLPGYGIDNEFYGLVTLPGTLIVAIAYAHQPFAVFPEQFPGSVLPWLEP